MFELEGLQGALSSTFVCRVCHSANISLQENTAARKGLCTALSIVCGDCSNTVKVPYSVAGGANVGSILSVNLKSVVANKCIGGSFASLQMFCNLLGLPSPISKNIYTQYHGVVVEACMSEANESMERARKEAREFRGIVSDDEVIDVLISVDGSWHRRGHSSMFGTIFVVDALTGKVLDYEVYSKYCKGCAQWESKNKDTDEYRNWMAAHAQKCDINFRGSSGAMEPQGIVKLFSRSLDYKLRYKHYISDGDSASFSALKKAKPYGGGEEDEIIKLDCVGHVQKRLGTALRKLKTDYRSKKLSDGKSIGGKGRLTNELIDSLQNFYGLAIKSNKNNLDGMIKAVQASLLHKNSTDEQPRHHLCPEGESSWCGFQRHRALGLEFHHKKNAIPEAIVQLLKPIYRRLGDRHLLEKCVGGYTQNANEALHSLVWKFCPKHLFMGASAVKCGCALGILHFNDGVSSFFSIEQKLGCTPSSDCLEFLHRRDTVRIARSEYKDSDKSKLLRKKCRKGERE